MNQSEKINNDLTLNRETISGFLHRGIVKFVLPILIVIAASVPTFSRMLQTGIYTMHDFHVFRQFEFQKCLSEGVFPCRWAPDSGLGFGEPIFNFYGQLPYWFGAIPGLVGFQILDSVKLTFAFSLVASGLAMFLLARNFWQTSGAVLSGIIYLYAPYRAVDVWVRGALPEALGFIFFPLILHFLYRYLKHRDFLSLIGFTYSMAGLICTHNLSAFMFTPFLFGWWLYFSSKFKSYRQIIPLLGSGIFILGLSAFYLSPVIFESGLTTISKTTQIYYDFHIHYATLNQLFLSPFWGYGGSTWGPNDTLSFSVGFWHWLLPLSLGIYLLVRKIIFRHPFHPEFFLFLILSLLAVFLTHGKSDPLWNLLPGLSFVQFPWRFLTMAAVFLSLSVGLLADFFPSKIGKLVIFLVVLGVIATNASHYRPDIWLPLSDSQYFSGQLWDEQRSSALQDYWPLTAPEFPQKFAGAEVIFNSGLGRTVSGKKLSSGAEYSLFVASPSARISFPIVYFPGWQGTANGQRLTLEPFGRLGLISTVLASGDYQVRLTFSDTPSRFWGNLISLVFICLSFYLIGFIRTRYVQK